MSHAEPLSNISLERQVLGRMMAFEGHVERYLSYDVEPADFYRVAHRQVFEAILAVREAGAEPNAVAILHELRRREQIESVGGPDYLSGLLLDIMPAPEATIAAECGELVTLRAGRELQRHAPALDLGRLQGIVDRALLRTTVKDRTYDSAQQLEAVREDIARDAAGVVWLGLPAIDHSIEGVRVGEVCGIMARPGIGKTVVLCHVASVAAETGLGHVLFSLEMPTAKIVDRLGAMHFGISRHQFRERLTAGTLHAKDYMDAFQSLVIVDAPSLSVAQMTAKVRQIQSRMPNTPIRVVTIDHLGLIGGDRKQATYDRVSNQAREVKDMAKRLNVSVLLAVQVNRESGGDGSKELSLGSARDSGVVEEAMDYLIALRRMDRSQTLSAAEREKYRDVLFCKVVKHRHGAPDVEETAVRILPPSLRLKEDPHLKIEEHDLTRIASMNLRGRR